MQKERKETTSPKFVHLVEIAKGLFFKHGLKRVTIEEICKKSRISKVTFYKYFNGKHQLAAFIRDELMKQGFSKFDEICNQNIGYPEKMNQMTQWRTEFVSQFSDEFIKEIMNLDDISNEVKRRYLKNIVQAQNEGEIRSELSPELIWLITEKLNEIVQEGSWTKVCSDFNEFQIQIRSLYFYGLLNQNK